MKGLDIKILADYYSYKNCLEAKRPYLEKEKRVQEIFIEESEEGHRPITSKKLKTVSSLEELLDEVVKEEIMRSRKDIPYYNFIHSTSSPELWNRRTLLQNCLFTKSQEQLLGNHEVFVEMVNEDTENSFNNQINEIIRDGGVQLQRKKNTLFDKYEKKKAINNNFEKKFREYVNEHYPFEDQSKETKEKISNWMLVQYCV